MNKEQLFEEIDEIYSEWHGGELLIGTERTERIKEALNRAINFIPCCTELCDCEIPKPIDPYHPEDKNICRDCKCNIV